jgi:acyl-CoA synthetase (AMP-forming)/AMP-acid ligase II
MTENDVLNFSAGNLAKYKIPKFVEFLEELPKNDAGKINKKELLLIHLNQLNNIKSK